MAYVLVTGLPETAKLNISAQLNQPVTTHVSDASESRALTNWQSSKLDLKLDVPGSLSRSQPATNTLWLNLSLNGPTDLAKLPSLLWCSGLSMLLTLLFSLTLSYLFMKLFRHIASNQIFDQVQVTRLIRIGQCMLVYTVCVLVAKWLTEKGAIIYLHQYGYRLSQPDNYNLNIGTPPLESLIALMGLCILALAQVFRYGTQLRQESELTI
ncbi:DUF2975 domain-containing protein [Fibrella aestuarina]|nr:DUF2975 domain-containing protein [Fibrella aestuarina]